MADEVINHFPAIIAALEEAAKVAVRQVAQDVTRDASSTSPYDTGALAASHYYVASDVSTYGQAVGAAEGANGEAKMLPEVDHPDSETEATVAVAASYGVYVHDGARGRAARPWLAQAAEGARGKVVDTVAKVISDAISKAGING